MKKSLRIKSLSEFNKGVKTVHCLGFHVSFWQAAHPHRLASVSPL